MQKKLNHEQLWQYVLSQFLGALFAAILLAIIFPDEVALAIGLSLTALILFAGPITGAGANPARYLGPALLSVTLGEFPVYVLGPLAGSAAASATFSLFMASTTDTAPSTSKHMAVPDPRPIGPQSNRRRESL